MTSENLQRTTYRDPTTPGNPVRTGNTTRPENALDMDQYYRPLERIHDTSLHGWGVASGLSVSASLNSPNTTITVLPGVALDSNGQHISLAVSGNAEIGPSADAPGANPTLAPVAATGVSLPIPATASGDKYLTIQFWETFDSDGFQNLGTFRYFHTPWLRLLDVAGFVNDGTRLVLAKVSLGTGATAGQVTALVADVRQGTDLPVGSIHLQRSVATSPAASVESVQAAEAGVIRAYGGGGIDVTVPNPTDEVHLERDDGGNFAKVSLGAERIVARQGNGAESVVIDTESGNITTPGSLTTSSVTASGSITASNINAQNSVVGNNVSANTATVSGSITAGSLATSGGVTAGSITSSGSITASSAAVSGPISGETIVSQTTAGYGVYAVSGSGVGVYAQSTDAIGVIGSSTNANGVDGSSSTGYGVHGQSDSNDGVYGQSNSSNGVVGVSTNAVGVYGLSSNGYGVYALTTNGTAVYAQSANDFGVSGIAGNVGVYGHNSTVNGNDAYLASRCCAGDFYGSVFVHGNLTKSGGSFQIDHPSDPANKYLYHSFVESPDMKNIYDGVATFDGNGEAVVKLPEWFQELNSDLRYQLTCIGDYAPVYIAEKVDNNRFKIAGGKPGLEVSWQVTGTRQDAWANANRVPVEEDKPPEEKGYYLHPDLYGAPEEKHIRMARYPTKRTDEKLQL